MKKIIAISVMFALIAGAVFADANISGGVGNGTQIVYTDTAEGSTLDTGGWGGHWGTLAANWTSEDNSAGAKLKINGDYNPGDKWGAGGIHTGGRIWWKPSDMFKIDLFKMQDEGVFGKGNYIDWGYQANSSAGNVTTLWGGNGWNSFSNGIVRSGVGFYGGSGNGFGAGLTFGPFGDIFTANLYLPLEDASETTDKLFSAHVQFLINIDGVGEIALSYRGAGAQPNTDGKLADFGGGDFFISTDLSQLLPDAMGIEVGFRYQLPGKDDDSKYPIEIGLGFGLNQWTSEAFQLFSRVGVVLVPDVGNIFAVDINPSIQAGDIGRVFFDVGVGFAMFNDKGPTDENSALVWHFNPYLKKPIGIGDFYVGINLWNNKIAPTWYEGPVVNTGIIKDDFINFSIPIYFEVSF